MSGETSYGLGLDDVLESVRGRAPGTPFTAREVADALSCSRRTAYDKLEALAERGDLATKKIGARGRVWWCPVQDGRPADEGRPVGDADTGEGTATTGERTATTGERTRQFAALAASTRTLCGTESRDEIGDVVVATLHDVVDVADAVVYRFDATENGLVPVAAPVGSVDATDREPIAAGADSPVWTSFVEGDVCVVDAEEGDGPSPDTPGGERLELAVPLGHHGVVVATVAARAGIEDARATVELVARVATTAFDCVESRAALREYEERLEEREQRLRRVTRIAEVVRAVDRALVDATTLEEVRSSVCRALTADEALAFAWVGTVEDVDGTVELRARAGEDHGYLDAVSLGAGDGPVEPAAEAASTGEIVVASNVADGLRRDPWRREAISQGLQSAVSVPLVHGGVRYGILTVYADRPGVFGEQERSVFAELGETIGSAMDAIETRERLLCDTVVELEFVLGGPTCFVSELADATGGEIRFNGVVPVTDERTRLFFTVFATSGETVTDAIEGTTNVESMHLVASRADQHLVEVVVAGRTIPSLLVDHEASIRTLTADGAEVRVAVDLPSAVDVRGFVERFQEEYPSAEFVARRERDRPIQTRQGFRSALDERLTDRQREVLETAYYSGLYATPRRSTVGEVADTLGVSQPTVTEHLQSAESKLLDLVFAEDATAD